MGPKHLRGFFKALQIIVLLAAGLEALKVSTICHLRTTSPNSLKIGNILHCFYKPNMGILLITLLFSLPGKIK